MGPLSSEKLPASSANYPENAVPEAAVRAELERLLASPPLRDSELLKRFLRYVVEHTLIGEGDHLKEYRLGVDVFDRDASFDPRLDPVVRMAARRLRAKLSDYYQNVERNPSLRIEIPKGGYTAYFVTVPDIEVTSHDTERQADRRSPKPTSASPWKWKVTAVVVLAALVGGGFYYHSRQTNRLTVNDTIVLADFANSTGDPVFDETLHAALTVSLQQSPFLNIVPDSKVASMLQMMTRPADTKLGPDVAREICERVGGKAYITGAIGSLGTEYVLGLKARNCQSGDTLAQRQVAADSKEKVLDALSKAASGLRGELGESLATVLKFDVPLAEATTSSLDALRAFSFGLKFHDEKGAAAALPYFQRALDLDPKFAMAYVSVSAEYGTLGELERARGYLAKAYELRERATEWERLRITANYYSSVTGDLKKAVETYQQEMELFPHKPPPYFSLGYVYGELGQYEKAAEVTRQSISLSPNRVTSYENMANYALALQQLTEARRVIREAQSRKLDDYVLHSALYALAFLGADSAAMTEQQMWYPTKREYEIYGLALESDTQAYAGHLAKARELTKRAIAAAILADDKENGAISQAIEAQWEAAYGNVHQASQRIGEALTLDPKSQGVEDEAALALAMMGDTKRAKSLAQDLERRFPLDTQVQSIWLPAIQAQLALDEKKPTLALSVLQATSTVEMGQIMFVNNISCLYPTYVRGEAYLAAGQGSAAAAQFQKILDHGGIVWNCWTGALARLGVARANALQAKTSQGADADTARVRALAAYQDFLTLWKDADPDIPILKQAKAEYAKLQQAGREVSVWRLGVCDSCCNQAVYVSSLPACPPLVLLTHRPRLANQFQQIQVQQDPNSANSVQWP